MVRLAREGRGHFEAPKGHQQKVEPECQHLSEDLAFKLVLSTGENFIAKYFRFCIQKIISIFRLNFMHLMDWTATIMDFGGIDPARANPDFDGMSFKDTFYNGNDVSPSPRKDLFMFMNGSPAVSFN